MKQKAQAKDIDSQMLAGCTSFVLVSFSVFGVASWPFLVFFDLYSSSQLMSHLLVGLIPASLVGIIACRIWKVPGALGFVGGSLTTAIFLYLRMESAEKLALAKGSPPVGYPDSMKALVPLGWILVSLFIALAALPSAKESSGAKVEPKP